MARHWKKLLQGQLCFWRGFVYTDRVNPELSLTTQVIWATLFSFPLYHDACTKAVQIVQAQQLRCIPGPIAKQSPSRNWFLSYFSLLGLSALAGGKEKWGTEGPKVRNRGLQYYFQWTYLTEVCHAQVYSRSTAGSGGLWVSRVRVEFLPRSSVVCLGLGQTVGQMKAITM